MACQEFHISGCELGNFMYSINACFHLPTNPMRMRHLIIEIVFQKILKPLTLHNIIMAVFN
jgi:hypothetical protein